MKIKTRELTGLSLRYAVAVAEGYGKFEADEGEYYFHSRNGEVGWFLTLSDFKPDENWEQGGPLIEREVIDLASPNPIDPEWTAMQWRFRQAAKGPTPLIAAMRCFVASRLGDEVEIPEELL